MVTVKVKIDDTLLSSKIYALYEMYLSTLKNKFDVAQKTLVPVNDADKLRNARLILYKMYRESINHITFTYYNEVKLLDDAIKSLSGENEKWKPQKKQRKKMRR